MDELLKEKEQLKKVLKVYRDVIASSKEALDSLPEMYKEDPLMMYNMSKLYVTKMESLQRNYQKPYFARIDFTIDGENEDKECYLGKVGVIDENNNLVTIDWRAPIASIYYDSSLGRASYEAPEGTITGDLTLKRQYDIENGELLDFRDVDLVSNDEILAPYLSSSADNRLKNIVASIQSEQNAIIRERINKNLIIQGVAGSGKTTVALHRVAYLVYNYINDIMPEQYMVIGPNKFFVNYISGVLPDLDVANVSQLTYDEVVSKALNEKFNFVSSEIKLSEDTEDMLQVYKKQKGKMDFKEAIEKFAKEYIDNIFGGSDLEVDGYVIVKGAVINGIYEQVKNDFLYKNNLNKQIDRVSLLVSKYIEDNFSSINNSLWNQYMSKSKSISDSNKKEEMKKHNNAKSQLEKKCKSTLKKYFKKSDPKIIPLYIEFLNNIKKYLDFNVDNMDSIINNDIAKLKAKKVEFEDLAPLLYLKASIKNIKEYEGLRHVVIDEAQDLGEFNFYVLKKVMPKATFSIFGDLAQSIYQYRSIDNWNDVQDKAFGNDCEVKHLLKSYRSTYEIINSANKVIDHIGMKEADPVIRHGSEVSYEDNDKQNITKVIDFINDCKKENYKSAAIITKTDEEAKELYKKVIKSSISLNLIDSKNTEYNGGLCIIPCYLAKGLEFDSVLISNASEAVYNSNSISDMKLLYVAMTRALHKLTILYQGELTNPLKNDINEDKKQDIRKKAR